MPANPFAFADAPDDEPDRPKRTRHVPSNMVWAVLSTLLCCLPLGLVAILQAAKVNGLARQGKYREAEKAAGSAKTLSVVGVLASVVVWLASVGVGAAMVYFAPKPTTPDGKPNQNANPFAPFDPPKQPKAALPPGWDAPPQPLTASRQLPAGQRPKVGRAGISAHDIHFDERAVLGDGPAAATAAHVHDRAFVVGYADGSTALWDMDRPHSEPPAPGPKFAAAVDRVWLTTQGRYLLAESGGELWVATARPPFKAIPLPLTEYAVGVIWTGAAMVVFKGADGYDARWLVLEVDERATDLPPRQFGRSVFGDGKKLDAPPAAPRFLTWVDETPAAFLPDGRIFYWHRHDDGKGQLLPDGGKPTAWAAGPSQQSFTTVDAGGRVQIRRTNYAVAQQFTADPPPTRVYANPDGLFAITADDAGGVTLWRTDDRKPKATFTGTLGTPDTPVRPLAGWGNSFVVGIGKRVELWSAERSPDYLKTK